MSICILGSINVDWVAQVRLLPQPGETVLASALARRVGGKGANQAVAAARAGSATRLVGRVGRDETGDWIVGYLATAGVDTAALTRGSAPTGQAFITLSDSGENSIVVVPGANAQLTLPDGIREIAADDRVLLMQLETSLEPIAQLARMMRPGCVKILNAAPARLEAVALFDLCDLIVVNETELGRYARLADIPCNESQIVAAASSLIHDSRLTVIVTRGARGVMWVRSDETVSIGARSASVVDTVGAGDCFCGVLAAGLDRGLPLRSAVERANAAAALSVGRAGAAEAMPSKADIDAACEP